MARAFRLVALVLGVIWLADVPSRAAGPTASSTRAKTGLTVKGEESSEKPAEARPPAGPALQPKPVGPSSDSLRRRTGGAQPGLAPVAPGGSLAPMKSTNPMAPGDAQRRRGTPPGGAREHTFQNPSRRLSPLGSDPGSEPVGGHSADGQHFAPDPCGDRYEIETIQAGPPLDPGEQITIHGCGFGSNPPGGSVWLLGDFPGGKLKLDRYGWTPHGIVAVVPQVSGVSDMDEVRIQVVRADGTPSNWFDAGGFRAAREVKRLAPGDVAIECGGSPSECALATNPGGDASFVGEATFAAKHRRSVTPKEDECSALEMLGGSEERTDTIHVQLRNGWQLTGDMGWSWGRLAGQGYVNGPPVVPADVAAASLPFVWKAVANRCHGAHDSTVRYRVELWARGPRGVPLK